MNWPSFFYGILTGWLGAGVTLLMVLLFFAGASKWSERG